MTADPARLATARTALAAVHRLHDAALDASNRILWPLLPHGDATHTAAYSDARDALIAALGQHGLETHMLEERETVADCALSGLATALDAGDDDTRADDYGADMLKEDR